MAFFLTIFIGNLSWDAEREDLVHLFSQYGEVRKCSLPLDRETGRKRGFAFVDLANAADEKSAIDDLQDVEWMGRGITVRQAEPRRCFQLGSALADDLFPTDELGRGFVLVGRVLRGCSLRRSQV